ncbi:MAG: hypothetical protein PHG74_12480 [Kiritimatiellae bacterium]|jgi:hypothetical protein|nr:hypothetical protein [Kiritimatiellia bacterium]MDD3584823.1 hypothetical protein [Kiritimatiellia bacterium]
MTLRRWIQIGWLAALAVIAMPRPAQASVSDLDHNDDGVIRIAWLSTPQQAGDIDAAEICSDLESMLKAAKPGKPVRVALVPITLTRTLMGWWYHPDAQTERTQLFSGGYDVLVLAEHDACVSDYPEFFFEGVRAINAQARTAGLRTVLAVMSKPGLSFRDKRLSAIAETVYRVGDGCNVEVIPAAFAWHETLARNRLPGTSPIRARACAYLTAAAVYVQLADKRVPKGAFDTYWTTRRTTEVLARSARDAVTNARATRHYSGPFSGVVRIEPRIKQQLKIYVPNTFSDDPLRQNLQFILDAAFQEWFWKTPSEWYTDGFDRYASAFDLVYGDVQQMSLYADPQLYTSLSLPPTNQPPPCTAVFSRTPTEDPDGLATLRRLESLLIEGYDFAKSRGMVYVPYPLAWARAYKSDAALVRPPQPGRVNDWLTYMLANMLYTTVTDRFLPPPEKVKPQHANTDHPRGWHDLCARIGFDTLRQLSTLHEPVNALLLSSGTYRIDTDRPGFVSIRLLDRPERETRVFCATDLPGVAQLSRESLVFTPDNYDIEQTIRILPATNAPSLFFHIMASAQSEDKSIDGANDLRPFLLNLDDDSPGSLVFDRTVVSPRTGYTVMLRPTTRPCEIVRARIAQNGRFTQEVYFSPDHDSGSPVQLAPTADDYAKGTLSVTVTTTSDDRRFHDKSVAVTFRVSADGIRLPNVRVTAPVTNSVIEGPAFVTARAEADASVDIGTLALFLDHKRLGLSATPVCTAAVEKGPPQSRLSAGSYTLWAAATTTNGLVVGSAPVTFSVREPLTHDTPAARVAGPVPSTPNDNKVNP